MQAESTINSDDKEAIACGGLVDIVLEIGQQSARIMKSLCYALLREDDAETLEYARKLTEPPARRSTQSCHPTQTGL